jgi:hypothetical protein
VHHKGNPDLLPSDQELEAAGHEGIDKVLSAALEDTGS